MPLNLGLSEILLLLVVAVLVFGGNLPDAARRIGRSISELRRGWNEEIDKVRSDLDAGDEPPPEWKPPPDGEDCTGLGG